MTDKIRVLIVDDAPETRENVRRLLQFEVDIVVIGQAGTGEQAIKMAQELQPDIILMDINMPGIDGLAATDQISDLVPRAQTIIMSVQAGSDYLRRAMTAGARDYLLKPFGGNALIKSVQRAYKKRPSTTSGLLVTYPRPSNVQKMPAASELHVEIDTLKIFNILERVRLYQRSVVEGYLVDELARLAAGIAHDLRSPISIILSILHKLENLITQSGATQKYVERIQRRTLYCRWLIDNFLGISFNEKVSISYLRLWSAVSSLLDLIKDRFPPGLHLHINIPRGLLVWVDSDLFELVFMNVVINALEAMPDGGILEINTELKEDKVEIIIKDTGYGVLDENEDRLFSIGFSTKPAQGGCGLYVAKRMLQLQLGNIVYVGPNGASGAIFTLSLLAEPATDLYDKFRATEEYLQELEAKIQILTLKVVSRGVKKDVAREFERITTTFAHHLYNELAVIETTVKELLTQAEVRLKQDFIKIARSSAYSQLLVRNMMEIGKTELPSWSFVSVVDVIEEVLELLERKMPPDLYSVEWNIDLTVAKIEADETQLKQVFMNLIRNALDAMPEGGCIELDIMREETQVIIQISDSGVGIPPENLERLFTLGFTTKPEGYGIGLFSIKTIINKHGGTIKTTSPPGSGATFTVTLPLRQKDLAND